MKPAHTLQEMLRTAWALSKTNQTYAKETTSLTCL